MLRFQSYLELQVQHRHTSSTSFWFVAWDKLHFATYQHSSLTLTHFGCFHQLLFLHTPLELFLEYLVGIDFSSYLAQYQFYHLRILTVFLEIHRFQLVSQLLLTSRHQKACSWNYLPMVFQLEATLLLFLFKSFAQHQYLLLLGLELFPFRCQWC